MRRVVTIFLSTVTALVLLLTYHTSTDSASVAASPVVQTPTSTATASPSTEPSASASPPTTPETTPEATTAPSAASTSYTGEVVHTEWGPVQVRISVLAGKITASEAVQYPNNNHRDVQINSYAVPILNEEVVQQQSASIDSVSGATVTSEGYLQSLQSAIDQAHL